MQRRVTDATAGFLPCRVDTAVFDPEAYVLQGSKLPHYHRDHIKGAEVANAEPSSDVMPTEINYSKILKRQESEQNGQRGTNRATEESARDALRRANIVAREQQEAGDWLSSESGSSIGGGALGSGLYTKPKKSISSEHGFVLNVMDTNHPARLTMRRKANDMLLSCITESPQSFNELALMLKGLEPIGMSSRPSSASVTLLSRNQGSRPSRAVGNVIPKPPSVLRNSRPSTAASHTAQYLRSYSSTDVPKGSTHVHFEGEPQQKQAVSNTDLQNSRPRLSDPIERRTASAPNVSPPDYHYQHHYAIGSTPNKFYISSLPKEIGGNIASLAHTIRPSDMIPDIDLSGVRRFAKNDVPPCPPSSARNSKRDHNTFSESYTAYGEPLTKNTPLLFDSADQKVGQVYVFGPNQSAPLSSLTLKFDPLHGGEVRKKMTHHSTVEEENSKGKSLSPRVNVEKRTSMDVTASGSHVPTALAPQTARRPASKCGVSFSHEKLLSERRAQQEHASGKQIGEKGTRSTCWSMSTTDRFDTPVPGELKPCWVQNLESQAKRRRLADEKITKLKEKQRADGVPIPLEATQGLDESEKGTLENNDIDRRGLLLSNTVPDHPLKPHIPATRFVGAPRNFSFQSKSHHNFVARAPGPGSYSTPCDQFSARRHHRVRSVAGCKQAKLL